MDSLKQKSVDGVIWTLLEKFGSQFIKIILGVILARLLTPTDYGLIGMISVFFAISMVFIDSGFGLAYVQKQDADDKDASTIFYFNLVVSTLLYLVLWFTAPLIADFYGEDQLLLLIRVMGCVLIINSFGLIQISKLKKNVDFKNKTLIMLGSAILAICAGIIAALLNYGVWSLVIQEIVRATLKSLGLWIFYKSKPLVYFSFKSLKTMLSFSLWSLFTSILTSIFNNINILVIGKYFPAAQLGFYTKAQTFQGMVSQQPSSAVGSVAFPVFAKIQHDKMALKNAIRKFIRHAMFFVVPLAAILIVIAKPFILLLLTEKWLPMAPYFQLLLLAGVLYPMQLINVQVLSAQGKMKLTFNLSMIKNTLRVLNVIIMYRFGVIFIIYGEIINSYLALVINTYYTKKFVDYGTLEQLKDVSTIILTSGLLSLLGFMLLTKIPDPYLKIMTGVLFIGSFYLIGIYLFDKKLLKDNFIILRNKITGNKNL